MRCSRSPRNDGHSSLGGVTNPTLRVLADLPQQPVSLSESTLILIDCQNTYTRGVMELEGVQEALDEAAALLDRARSLGIPIIHIQHDDGPDSLYDIEGESGAIVSRVAPRNGEPVVVKNYPNSFVQTDLDEVLKTSNASNLVLAGFMTHMCVNSTARGAFNLGYAPTVVAAATATRALPGLSDDPVSAEVMQAASLASMADLFAVVVPSASDIPD
jgi:nicotinamidase-related amidase